MAFTWNEDVKGFPTQKNIPKDLQTRVTKYVTKNPFSKVYIGQQGMLLSNSSVILRSTSSEAG